MKIWNIKIGEEGSIEGKDQEIKRRHSRWRKRKKKIRGRK